MPGPEMRHGASEGVQRVEVHDFFPATVSELPTYYQPADFDRIKAVTSAGLVPPTDIDIERLYKAVPHVTDGATGGAVEKNGIPPIEALARKSTIGYFMLSCPLGFEDNMTSMNRLSINRFVATYTGGSAGVWGGTLGAPERLCGSDLVACPADEATKIAKGAGAVGSLLHYYYYSRAAATTGPGAQAAFIDKLVGLAPKDVREKFDFGALQSLVNFYGEKTGGIALMGVLELLGQVVGYVNKDTVPWQLEALLKTIVDDPNTLDTLATLSTPPPPVIPCRGVKGVSKFSKPWDDKDQGGRAITPPGPAEIAALKNLADVCRRHLPSGVIGESLFRAAILAAGPYGYFGRGHEIRRNSNRIPAIEINKDLFYPFVYLFGYDFSPGFKADRFPIQKGIGNVWEGLREVLSDKKFGLELLVNNPGAGKNWQVQSPFTLIEDGNPTAVPAIPRLSLLANPGIEATWAATGVNISQPELAKGVQEQMDKYGLAAKLIMTTNEALEKGESFGEVASTLAKILRKFGGLRGPRGSKEYKKVHEMCFDYLKKLAENSSAALEAAKVRWSIGGIAAASNVGNDPEKTLQWAIDIEGHDLEMRTKTRAKVLLKYAPNAGEKAAPPIKVSKELVELAKIGGGVFKDFSLK